MMKCRDCRDQPCICKTESELFGIIADVIADARPWGGDKCEIEILVLGLNLSHEDTRFVTRIAVGELRKEQHAAKWVEQQEPNRL